MRAITLKKGRNMNPVEILKEAQRETFAELVDYLQDAIEYIREGEPHYPSGFDHFAESLDEVDEKADVILLLEGRAL